MTFSFGGPHPASFDGATFNDVAGDFNSNLKYSWSSGPPPPHRTRQTLETGVHRTERRARNIAQGAYNIPHPRRAEWTRRSACNPDTMMSIPPFLGPSHYHPSFTAVRGTMTSVTSYGENGLDILYRSVVGDAMHNSADRPPDPSCRPGTRKAVLDKLHAWARSDNSGGRMFWLHGAAGAGKSAIAQDFASRCQEEGILGASFFFKRGSSDRGTWKALFPTIAYQLAASFGELAGPIQRAIERDRLAVQQAMRHQVQKLLIRPFQEAPPLSMPLIIVIDGLDECQGHDTQVALLHLMLDAIGAETLPARILVVSRPEPHLREVLEAANYLGICRHHNLGSDNDVHADIYRYLSEEFSRIRRSHGSRGLQLEETWPGADTIKHLVRRSWGIFIYATTVVRYIDSEYSIPTEQLDRVLSLDPESTAPLDTLYTQILSRVPNRPLLGRILHAVVRVEDEFCAEELDVVLELRKGTVHVTLRGLHSLLWIPPAGKPALGREPVTFLHTSFRDFLIDPARSANFCVARPDLDCQLVCSMIKFLSTHPAESVLRRIVATGLAICIVRAPPRAEFLSILHDAGVHHSVFSIEYRLIPGVLHWLESFSPPPMDLIQLWEDLRFICELDKTPHPPADKSETQDDESFMRILSQNPQTLSVLRVLLLLPPSPCPGSLADAVEFLGFSCNVLDVLRPLCVLRGHLEPDRIMGSLLQFLGDHGRAGFLYEPQEEKPQFTAFHAISRIQQSDFACPPTEDVIHKLRNLNVSRFCTEVQRGSMAHYTHRQCHWAIFPPSMFRRIIDWIKSLPSPPKDVVKFWEDQLSAVEDCDMYGIARQ